MRSSSCAAFILLSIASSAAMADLTDEIPVYASEELDQAIEWAEGLSEGGSIIVSSEAEQFAAYDPRGETIGAYDMGDTFQGE